MLIISSSVSGFVFASTESESNTALEVPTTISSENRDGLPLIIKSYIVPPDTNPASLIEEPFSQAGYKYTYSSTTKTTAAENRKWQTETVTINTNSGDLSAILAALEPTMPYDDGVYSGTLTLDHTSINTEAAGYTSKSYTVSETKQLGGLDRNDPSYVPKTTVKGGRTLSLSHIEWAVEGTGLAGDSLVPTSYTAFATYSGSASQRVAIGYVSNVRYAGEITGNPDINYQVTYIGQREILYYVISIAATAAFLGLLTATYFLVFAKNVKVYAADPYNSQSRLISKHRVSRGRPLIDITKADHYPLGEFTVVIKRRAAIKLYGKLVIIRLREATHSHLIEQCHGDDYWITISAEKSIDGQKGVEQQ